MVPEPVFLGIDAGTSGVRALAAAWHGSVIAKATAPLSARRCGSHHEQEPAAWWSALCLVTRRVMQDLPAAEQLRAVAVTGTSGTLVCTSKAAEPLRPALMYDDTRGISEATWPNRSPSLAIAKAGWIRRHEPAVFARTARFMSQAGWLSGCLSGDFGMIDYSNALKMGYELVYDRWPDWIGPDILHRLPAVVAPGAPIGVVSARAAAATGLPEGLPVVAGATDGTAAAIASGLREGSYNVTLGTTLVFKGLTATMPTADGRYYCHKLPGGLWLPGAASNTGASWIAAHFPGAPPADWDREAAPLLPSQYLAYPLVGRGERFPFERPNAEGFIEQCAVGPVAYAACLQGTAFIERLGLEELDALLPPGTGEVFATGGGCQSDVWLQCRADVTGRVYHRSACLETALGAAIVAAVGAGFGTFAEAMAAMTNIGRTIEPSATRFRAYEGTYRRFRAALADRGYL